MFSGLCRIRLNRSRFQMRVQRLPRSGGTTIPRRVWPFRAQITTRTSSFSCGKPPFKLIMQIIESACNPPVRRDTSPAIRPPAGDPHFVGCAGPVDLFCFPSDPPSLSTCSVMINKRTDYADPISDRRSPACVNPFRFGYRSPCNRRAAHDARRPTAPQQPAFHPHRRGPSARLKGLLFSHRCQRFVGFMARKGPSPWHRLKTGVRETPAGSTAFYGGDRADQQPQSPHFSISFNCATKSTPRDLPRRQYSTQFRLSNEFERAATEVAGRQRSTLGLCVIRGAGSCARLTGLP